jgi:hypothetical protein
MAFQILKARHSLIGRRHLKAWNGEDFPLNRLKKEYPLEEYSLVELRREFEKLTGESAKDIIALAGKEEDLEGNIMRVLVHYAIEQANSVGAPRGNLYFDRNIQGCLCFVKNLGYTFVNNLKKIKKM